MNRFPSALRRYVLSVALCGVAAGCLSWLVPGRSDALSLPLMAALAGTVFVAECFPQHVLKGSKLSWSTGPVFAAVLCLPLGAAVTVSVLGVLGAELFNRRPWFEATFNAACTAVQVCAAGVLWLAAASLGSSPWIVVSGAILVAMVLHLANVSVVAGAVSTQQGMQYRQIWPQMASTDAGDQLLMFALGASLALLFLGTSQIGTVVGLVGAVLICGVKVASALPARRQAASSG
jgi:hypothetical protein